MRKEMMNRYTSMLKIQHFCKAPPDFFVPLPEEVDIKED